MPRGLRLEIPDGVYHVTNRGVDRMNIVRDDADRRTWLRLFDRVARRCGWRVFAYVLMDNHFHIFVRTPQPNLSQGMHDFESGYASNFNRRHGRVGPLVQGRFHAVVVECDPHAWELSRYVHLNPVRAGKTSDPGTYLWSSFQYYLNPSHAPAWLDWRTVLAEFAGTESAARLGYRRFVLSGIAKAPTNPLDRAIDGLVLGSPEFVDRVFREFGIDGELTWQRRQLTIDGIVAMVADLTGVDRAVIRSRGRHGNTARDLSIYLCRELVGVSLDAVAGQFGGVTRSAVTDAVRRCRERATRLANVQALVDAARSRLLDNS